MINQDEDAQVSAKLDMAKIKAINEQKDHLGVVDDPAEIISNGTMLLSNNAPEAAAQLATVFDQLDPAILSGISTPKGSGGHYWLQQCTNASSC